MSRKKTWWFSKFDWDAWLSDPGLSCCSPAARGVWMDLLGAAHKSDPPGHVTIDGKPPSIPQLAKIARCNQRALPALLSELEKNSVFSKTSAGVIFSRRMVRDHEAYLRGVKNGGKNQNSEQKQLDTRATQSLNGTT